ncbi:MAG: histidinol-phosphate transaminase [Luminiphilus sp.]|nr:histidinol-phosphate transaminase [Luminiphilus sp.]
MSRFWVDTVQALKPYVPGEQPRSQTLLKLNTNEHALPPSESAMAVLSSVDPDQLRRYPDPTARRLRDAIANRESLGPEQVFVGNGSDEVLAHVWAAFLSGRELTTVKTTYGFYPVWSRLYGAQLNQVALCDDFSVDLNALQAVGSAIVLANPNAPTGLALKRMQVEELVASNRDRLVVIDEAYFGFGAETAAPLVSDYDNLVVTRSLSKSHALAGLRVGYALAHPELIEGLVRIKDSFNSYPIDALAQAVATASIEDVDWFNRSSAVIAHSREKMSQGLQALRFVVLPSQSNFVFVKHPAMSGKKIFNALRERNILVRRWDTPFIAEWLRISLGTAEETDQFLHAVNEITATGA